MFKILERKGLVSGADTNRLLKNALGDAVKRI
jgi:hypothetical protein